MAHPIFSLAGNQGISFMNINPVLFRTSILILLFLCSTAFGNKVLFKNGDSLTSRYLRTERSYGHEC